MQEKLVAFDCSCKSIEKEKDEEKIKELLIEQKRMQFLKLLRQGVREKMIYSSSSNAIKVADGVEAQVETHEDHAITSKVNKISSVSWQTLCWRDVFSTQPYFQETLCGQRFEIKQILQGEMNGFGTGLTVWPAACVLLKYLEFTFGKEKQKLQAQCVLELGSGTGAVGIAAAMLQAKRVVLTDIKKILFLLQENATFCQQKYPKVSINVEEYEWGNVLQRKKILSLFSETADQAIGADNRRDQSLSPALSPTPLSLPDQLEEKKHLVFPDLILVSDCILPKLYPLEPLVIALEQLSQKGKTRILLSYEHRYFPLFDPKQTFWKLLQAKGFAIRQLKQEEYHPHYRAQDIEIWEATL